MVQEFVGQAALALGLAAGIWACGFGIGMATGFGLGIKWRPSRSEFMQLVSQEIREEIKAWLKTQKLMAYRRTPE